MSSESLLIVGGVLAMLLLGCKDQPSPAKPPATRPRVASLVPAATDLIIGMGASEHLVARSDYDIDRAGTVGLPKVGAYSNLDWEKIAAAKPDVMIVFMAPDRMPEALRQRDDAMKIRLVNVRTERLEDIFTELAKLGDVLGESQKAKAAAESLRSRLNAIQTRVASLRKIRTLIVRDQSTQGVVGRDNFINDALQIAGGENVIESTGWPNIDREKLLSLKPEVIFHLLPDASPQVFSEAEHAWAAMPRLPAVANHRVHILTDWWVQQPGFHLPELAEQFAAVLHARPAEATP